MTNIDAPIDVNQLSEVVSCPLCRYSLRGTTESRCPECGYEFDWPDLLDPDRRRHLYLFEQHPRRNILSVFRTLAAGFLPNRFWIGLLPSHQMRPGRLVFYGLSIQLFCLIGVILLIADDVLYFESWMSRERNLMVAEINSRSPAEINRQLAEWNERFPDKHFESVEDFFRFIHPGILSEKCFLRVARMQENVHLAMLSLLPLLWLPLTYLILRVFRWSMRSKRIAGWQVFRSVVYSSDALFLLGVLFWGFGLNELRIHFFPPQSQTLGGIGAIDVAWYLAPILLVHMTWRLYRAYQKYLRFPNPAATVFSSQLVVLMVIAIGTVLIQAWANFIKIV